jgi:hypothetical protein
MARISSCLADHFAKTVQQPSLRVGGRAGPWLTVHRSRNTAPITMLTIDPAILSVLTVEPTLPALDPTAGVRIRVRELPT